METTLTVPPVLASSKTLTEGKDAAGVLARSMVTDARDLAGLAGEKAQEKAHDLAAEGSRRYGKRVKKRAKKLERRAEKLARKLPLDTPLDQHRRRRAAGRGARTAMLVLGALGLATVVYFAWQRRQSTTEEAAPDAFGAAVDKTGNGRVARHAPV
jgi:hypothetical protein